jgi:hypothetical protein
LSRKCLRAGLAHAIGNAISQSRLQLSAAAFERDSDVAAAKRGA